MFKLYIYIIAIQVNASMIIIFWYLKKKWLCWNYTHVLFQTFFPHPKGFIKISLSQLVYIIYLNIMQFK